MKIVLSVIFLCLSVPAFCSDSAVANDAEAVKDSGVVKESSVYNEETRTLFSMSNLSLSGYGAPVIRFSKMGDSYSTLMGGRGGLIINDNFVIGAGGMGLAHPRDRSDFSGKTYTGNYDRVDFAYGGGLLEYYFSPKSLFGFSAGTTIGGGGLTFHSRKESNDDDEYGSDVFFVAEPEVNFYINVTKFCRIGAGVSYRFIRGIGIDEFDDKDFRGPSVGIIIAFGWF